MAGTGDAPYLVLRGERLVELPATLVVGWDPVAMGDASSICTATRGQRRHGAVRRQGGAVHENVAGAILVSTPSPQRSTVR